MSGPNGERVSYGSLWRNWPTQPFVHLGDCFRYKAIRCAESTVIVAQSQRYYMGRRRVQRGSKSVSYERYCCNQTEQGVGNAPCATFSEHERGYSPCNCFS